MKFLLIFNLFVGFGVVNSYAEGHITSPLNDKPPVDTKENDYEGLINGFSSDANNLTQNDADFYMIKSLKENLHSNYVQCPDSTLGNNMEEYFNLLLPNLLNTDSLNFELIEIL